MSPGCSTQIDAASELGEGGSAQFRPSSCCLQAARCTARFLDSIWCRSAPMANKRLSLVRRMLRMAEDERFELPKGWSVLSRCVARWRGAGDGWSPMHRREQRG